MNYYNQNAKLYFESTLDVDMSKLQKYFLSHLPRRGEILDIGCGSGRDSKVFMENGYHVLPLEPNHYAFLLVKWSKSDFYYSILIA